MLFIFLSVFSGWGGIGAEPVCLPLKGWVFSGQLLRNCVESLSFRSCLRCPRVLVSAVMHFVCSAAATHPQWQMKVDALPYWDKWGGTGERTAGTSAVLLCFGYNHANDRKVAAKWALSPACSSVIRNAPKE